jgi:hypothetical protein
MNSGHVEIETQVLLNSAVGGTEVALSPRKEPPVPIGQRADWASGQRWALLTLTGIEHQLLGRLPLRPALFWLSYLDSKVKEYIN